MEYRVPITGSRSVTQTAYRVDKNKAAPIIYAPHQRESVGREKRRVVSSLVFLSRDLKSFDSVQTLLSKRLKTGASSHVSNPKPAQFESISPHLWRTIYRGDTHRRLRIASNGDSRRELDELEETPFKASNTVKERLLSRQKLGIRRATRQTATPRCRFRLDISCSVKLIHSVRGGERQRKQVRKVTK